MIENPDIIQLKNPRSQKYVRINKLFGRIIPSGKGTPYKNIPIVSKNKKGEFIYEMPETYYKKYDKFLEGILNCNHSFIECRGLGGGRIFEYCNKCGITKSILNQLQKI